MNLKCCATDYDTWHKRNCKKGCPENKYWISCTKYPTRCSNGKKFNYKKFVGNCNDYCNVCGQDDCYMHTNKCRYEDKCYVKCSHYNKDCQCAKCNDKYMRCYYKCKGKNTCCNNINKPLDPRKPCLFGTVGVIYPIINQNIHPCGPCN